MGNREMKANITNIERYFLYSINMNKKIIINDSKANFD